jgi:hypothetical protein
VEFGFTPQLGQVVSEDGVPESEHEVRLDELKPRGTKYYVRFRIAGTQGSWASPLLSFRTLLRYSYGYSFSPEDPRLRWQPGASRIVIGQTDPFAPEVLQRIQGVDPESYLQHIILTITQPQMSRLEKVKAIMTFIGHAVHHNPLYLYTGMETEAALVPQNPPGEPEGETLKTGGERLAVTILELHNTRCGYVNSITAALTRLIGVEAGNWVAPSHHHLSGRVLINEKWYFADQDAYKKGAYPLMSDGSLPPLDWVLKGENVYLLDTKPGWIDLGSKGHWVLTKDGFLITGYMGGGQDQSEDGYPSVSFGGRPEFPPSIPRPLPVTRFGPESVLLEWVGSYDRDNDFRDYVLEVGTSAGLSDVGRFCTKHAFYEVKLPQKGTYYWRVAATDFHASGTPYAGKVYYDASEESSFNTAKLQQDTNDPSKSKSIKALDDELFSLDLKDGSLGGFEPRDDASDLIGEGSTGGTGLFNIEWGKEGRVLELMDPTNRWLSTGVARRSWYNAVTATISPGESWEMSCAVRTGRSYMAGNSSFPLLFVTDRTDQRRAIGITLNPEPGTVSGAVKDGVSWTNLDAFDPQNEWHTYTVRFSGREKPGDEELSMTDQQLLQHRPGMSFFVDGKQLGQRTAIPEAITPGGIWISSNPDAEVIAWIAKIQIHRGNSSQNTVESLTPARAHIFDGRTTPSGARTKRPMVGMSRTLSKKY